MYLQKTDVKKRLQLNSNAFIKLAFLATFFGGLFLKFFYFQFTTKINVRPFTERLNIYMYAASLGILFIIAAFVFILFNRKRYAALLVIHIFLTVLLFADTVYFRYYYHPLSVTIFYQIGVVDSIGGSALSLFKLKDIIFILDMPFMVFFYLLIKKNRVEKLSIIKKTVLAVIMLAVGITPAYTAYSKVNKSAFTLDNYYVAKYLGVGFYHYYDAKNFIKERFFDNRSLTAEEKKQISEYYSNKPKTEVKYNGIANGKNLIIIQVEALQEFLMNREINGQEITPNLNKLIKESAYFNNFYYQIGDGNTSDAEFLANTSLYPIRNGSVNFRYPGNKYQSIAEMLYKKGYDTMAFHANRPSFWNRSVMFKSLGFKSFYSDKNFTIDDKVGWGLSDASFFKQSLSKINIEKPFYSLIITLSSHFPYNFDYSSRSNIDTGKYKDTILGKYISAQNYTDSCIGEFIDDLKEKGLYDNSILVIYGDHYAIPKHNTNDFDDFLNVKYSDFEWTKIQKVPLIIHYPGLENGRVINTTGGEIDIMPTVANLMGLDAGHAIGKDLFNTKAGYALLRNGSLVTDKYVYIKDTAKAYDINAGNPIDEKIYKEELQKYIKEYDISQLIVEKNAFKK